MPDMKEFYQRLTSAEASKSPYLSGLVRLTRLGPGEISILKTEISWDYWFATPQKKALAE